MQRRQFYEDLDEKVQKMRKLKEHFIEGIARIENTTIHGLYDETSAPHIISVGFAGIRSEVLLHALEEKGIYVSSGSACASNHPQVSGVLKGIGAGQRIFGCHDFASVCRNLRQKKRLTILWIPFII